MFINLKISKVSVSGEVVPANPGKKIRVVGLYLSGNSTGTAASFTFSSGPNVGTNVIAQGNVTAPVPYIAHVTPPEILFQTNSGESLVVSVSTSGFGGGWIVYFDDEE